MDRETAYFIYMHYATQDGRRTMSLAEWMEA